MKLGVIEHREEGVSFQSRLKFERTLDRAVKATMKTTKLITAIAVSVSLAFGVAAQAGGKKHKEQSISSTDVPAEVQKAAETEANGGKIVRWEKEGANYEAVIEQNGKQTGVKMDANGKVLSKHDKSKQHKKGENTPAE